MKHQTINVAGQDFVLVPAGDYDKLAGRTVAGIPLPPLPPADKDGNRPALEFARASIARDIITQMNALGVTAAELARDTGITPGYLSHIFKGTKSPSEDVIVKIEKALAKREPFSMNEAIRTAAARKGPPAEGYMRNRRVK